MARFPESLPILPVRHKLLLPGGQITQTLIEPRYINLVQDALAVPDRLVGVCIVDNSKKGRPKDSFYAMGCAGKITSFEEMVDGSCSVVLTGYCRFALGEEIPTMRKYRRFVVDCRYYEDDLVIHPHTNIDKDTLIALVRSYAEHYAIDMDWSVLPKTPAFNIITFFSMHLPFDDSIRQSLLVAKTVEDRGRVLMTEIQAVVGK